MSNVLFYNNSKTTLGAPVAPGDTTITLASGAGALFTPGPSGAQYFLITLSDALTGLNNEICKCTNISGDVLTVTRAQEGTTAQSWLVGDNAQGRITAGGLAAISAEVTEADKLTTPRLIAISGDGTWVVSFDGSANVTAALALATVNSNVGTFGDSSHVAQLTVDGKGRITACASVAIDFSAYAPLASPTFTGVPAGPTAAPGTNTTQFATTGFVTAAAALLAPLASPTFTGTPIGTTPASAIDNTTKIPTTAWVFNWAAGSSGFTRKAWATYTISGGVLTLVSSSGMTLTYVSAGVYTLTVGALTSFGTGALKINVSNGANTTPLVGFGPRVTSATTYTIRTFTLATTATDGDFIDVSLF